MPSNFSLFPKLKEDLCGCCFQKDQEVMNTIEDILKQLPSNFFCTTFECCRIVEIVVLKFKDIVLNVPNVFSIINAGLFI